MYLLKSFACGKLISSSYHSILPLLRQRSVIISSAGHFSENVNRPRVATNKTNKRNLRSIIDFHQADKLNPQRWQLIYYNDYDEKFANYDHQWFILAGGILMMIGGAISFCYFVYVFPNVLLSWLGDERTRKREYQEETAAVFISFVIFYAIVARYRRVRVLRIYESNSNFRRLETKKSKIFSWNSPDDADFCIVWKSPLLRSMRFFYKRQQAKKARERSTIQTMFLGNWRVRRRPWAIYETYFDQPSDFARVCNKV